MPLMASFHTLTTDQQRFLRAVFQKPGQKAYCSHRKSETLFIPQRAKTLEHYGYLKFVEVKQRKGYKVQVYKLTIAGRNEIKRTQPNLAYEVEKRKQAKKPKPTLEQRIENSNKAVAAARQAGKQVVQYTRKRSLPICPACGRRGEKHKVSHCCDSYYHQGIVETFLLPMNNIIDSCTVLHAGYTDDAMNERFPTLIKAGVSLRDLRYGSYQKVNAAVQLWGEQHPRLIIKAQTELRDFKLLTETDGRKK